MEFRRRVNNVLLVLLLSLLFFLTTVPAVTYKGVHNGEDGADNHRDAIENIEALAEITESGESFRANSALRRLHLKQHPFVESIHKNANCPERSATEWSGGGPLELDAYWIGGGGNSGNKRGGAQRLGLGGDPAHASIRSSSVGQTTVGFDTQARREVCTAGVKRIDLSKVHSERHLQRAQEELNAAFTARLPVVLDMTGGARGVLQGEQERRDLLRNVLSKTNLHSLAEELSTTEGEEPSTPNSSSGNSGDDDGLTFQVALGREPVWEDHRGDVATFADEDLYAELTTEVSVGLAEVLEGAACPQPLDSDFGSHRRVWSHLGSFDRDGGAAQVQTRLWQLAFEKAGASTDSLRAPLASLLKNLPMCSTDSYSAGQQDGEEEGSNDYVQEVLRSGDHFTGENCLYTSLGEFGLNLGGTGWGAPFRRGQDMLVETVYGMQYSFLVPPKTPLSSVCQSKVTQETPIQFFARLQAEKMSSTSQKTLHGLGVEDCLLRPGQLLYVPSGWFHSSLFVGQGITLYHFFH